MPILLNIVYEDLVHSAIIKKILARYKGKYLIASEISRGGRSYIQKLIEGLNYSANKNNPYLVLADLDHDVCAPSLIRRWLNGKSISKHLQIRIAVIEAEAWLLADKENISSFLSVKSTLLNGIDCEKLLDPKKTLIELAKKSRRREIREDIGNLSGGRVQGPGYNRQLTTFIHDQWQVDKALVYSDSLQRMLQSLENYLKSI